MSSKKQKWQQNEWFFAQNELYKIKFVEKSEIYSILPNGKGHKLFYLLHKVIKTNK